MDVILKANKQPVGPEDAIKYRAAEELNLLDRVLEVGWAGLTTQESGRVGGLISRWRRMGSGPEGWMG